MTIVSVERMREIERLAIGAGISSEQMMQRAGQKLAEAVKTHYSDLILGRVVGLIGKGNNGGDTLIALQHLLLDGWQGMAVLLTSRVNDPLFERFVSSGGQAILFGETGFEEELKTGLKNASVILDGLLGTGIKLPLKADAAEFLSNTKSALGQQKIVAVDCPSGVDCDSGEVAPETLPAALTVCMEAVKIGLVKEPAFSYCGEIETISLELPRGQESKGNEKLLVDKDWAIEHLPKRSAFSHKGSFGKVLIVGGSVNYFGAPLLSGKAAYRMGSGLVTLAVPQQVALTMAGFAPEITWLILDEEDGVIAEPAAELLIKRIGDFTCLAIGPGIGKEETTQRFLERVLFKPEGNNHRSVGFLSETVSTMREGKFSPLVLDADALRWLSQQEHWPERVKADLVLTPHPGEMSALTGVPTEELQKDRIGYAAEFAQKWHQVVVLKGALTVIAAPSGKVGVIPVATSALAKAGSGDVLTGIITSLIGQGMQPFNAATLGAWIHAQAGLDAAQKVGCEASVLASDIIASLPTVLSTLLPD